jgi:hypothetical protein
MNKEIYFTLLNQIVFNLFGKNGLDNLWLDQLVVMMMSEKKL